MLSMKNSLLDVYKNHVGKVSHKWDGYIDIYEILFEKIRYKPLRILEIGVQNGGSLEIWSKYFPNCEVIVGCDVHPKVENLVFADPRIKIVLGDANKDAVISQITSLASGFDLIIDDGSHISKDIVATFLKYFKHLSNDGLYVIEDLHASYWSNWGGGLAHPLSSISFLKRLVDILHKERWGVNKSYGWLLDLFSINHQVPLDGAPFEQIHSLKFYNSICVVEKKDASSNILGKGLVVGQDEFVSPGIKNFHEKYSNTPSQENNTWSNRLMPGEEELIFLRRENVALKEQLNSKK